VVRGGSWLFVSARARSAARDFDDPGYRGGGLGFRVLCSFPIE
jgi:formylglycine-generating enzyme required for sulfatase activity